MPDYRVQNNGLISPLGNYCFLLLSLLLTKSTQSCKLGYCLPPPVHSGVSQGENWYWS